MSETDNSDEKEGEDAWFWNTEYSWFCNLGESLLEHLECREEDDEESEPLNRWILFELFRYPATRYYHEDDRDDETDSEIHHIPMTSTSDCENIVEWHSNISDDDGLDSFAESCCRLAMFSSTLMRAYLSVELPYNIEEEYGSEELESWYLEEEYYPKWEYDAQDSGTSDSAEYGFFAHLWWEVLGCHTDEDSVISTHDEVDEDDIEQCECTCRGKKMSKVCWECIKHSEVGEGERVYRKAKTIQIFDREEGNVVGLD